LAFGQFLLAFGQFFLAFYKRLLFFPYFLQNRPNRLKTRGTVIPLPRSPFPIYLTTPNRLT
jgi:hypothetical protein